LLTAVKAEPQRSFFQFGRYLLVGGFNTIFGYGVFALFNWLLRRVPYGYLWATFFSNLIAITVAFLGYKWFVFKTKGHYLREWVRCLGVYGSSMALGLLGMAILVPILRHHMAKPQAASYLAAALLMGLTVIFSFLGNKHISFRRAAGSAGPPHGSSD
jgi:putative flippase GtrA